MCQLNSLLADKLNITRKIERDKQDIANLLGVFYFKGTNPKYVVKNLV